MPGVRFLLDECVPEFLADAMIREDATIEVVQVGQDAAPGKGTLDPDLLVYCEENRRTLVTLDKKTMPGHLQRHFALGRHTWGVIILFGGHSPVDYAEGLALISSLTPEDLVDWMDYLPWKTLVRKP
jgi:hypothetical protein